MPTNLEFRGRWLNIYGNLVAIALLTALTLGIYAPWGYARWQRIVTESTYFKDEQLEFDGSGAEVFVQFVIIGFYALITAGLYVILGFSSTRMLRWQYTHTLLPNGQRMDYRGRPLDIFWEWLLLAILTPLTLGIYYYWGRNRIRHRVLTNVSFNDQQVELGGTPGDYFLVVLSNWAMTVIAVAVYAALGLFLQRQLQETVTFTGQLGGAGTGFPIMDLLNLLLAVVASGMYALLGLGLLGLATVRFRGWEVSRTLAPTPLRARAPMPAIPSPVSPLEIETPTAPDAPEGVVEEERATAASAAPPRDSESEVGDDAGPPLPAPSQRGVEDEYYDFGDYSMQAGQEPGSVSGDERSDWSSEQWARPQARTAGDGPEETAPKRDAGDQI